MNDFLHEIWHDLRAKRLWPIAAALLVGLVAVPLLLLKPSSVPPPAATQAAAGAAQAPGGQVKVTTAANAAASNLGVFKGKDPFKGPGSARKLAGVVTAAPVTIPGAGKPAASKPSGGNSGGGSTPSSSPAPTTAPQSPATTTPKTKTTRYTYVVDVTFGKNGHLRRYRGLRRLAMLPDEESPLLISLGVDAKADNAVFIVDASVKAEGEGSCPPSGPTCALLYLGAGSEEFFTRDDGDSYVLRIDAIRKVTLAKAAKAGRARARKAKRSARASSRGMGLQPPVLNDLEIVATSVKSGSRPASHRR